MRTGIGYAAAAAFLGGARWLEGRYAGYARVLYGAGFSLLYVVTFATHYFEPARIFESPVVTLLLLALIVVAWAGLAQLRRSPTIALVSTLLGHVTIGLASFTLEEPGNYSGAGIVLLSAGSAFFLLRNRWYYVGAVGMLGSYLNQALLMVNSESHDLVPEFAVGMGILSVYFLIFALAELFADEGLRRKSVPTWFRSAFVTVNSACFFGLGSLVVAGFSFSEDSQHIFRYALALALLGIGLLYLRVRGKDPLHNAYLTKGSAMVTLGLAAQFSGPTLTTWLAVQVVVLLASARRSGLVVTRVLAFLVSAVTFAHAGKRRSPRSAARSPRPSSCPALPA